MSTTAERPATKRPTPGVYAANTSAAIDQLSKGVPGDVLTETDLGTAIGEPCDPKNISGYGVITRAIRYVRRDYNIAWQRDRTIPGWRCMSPDERIENVSRHGAKRVGRAALKNIELLAVDSSKLTSEQKREQQILQVTQGMILGATKSRFRRMIASKVADWDKLRKPTDPQLIELMRGTNGLRKD